MGRLDDMFALDQARLTGEGSDTGERIRVKPDGRGTHGFWWYASAGPWEDGLEDALGGYGLRVGRVAWSGKPAELSAQPDLAQRYLGI